MNWLLFEYFCFSLIQDGSFRDSTLLCHIYFKMMKFGTVIPYKKYMNHVAHPLSSADISSFAYRYRLRLVFSRFFCFCRNLGNVKENRLEKLAYPVKWSTWLYASTLPNFARRHFFNVNEVSNVFFWERDDKRGRLSKSFKDESLSVT